MRRHSPPGIIYAGHNRYRWDIARALPVRLYNRRETGNYLRRKVAKVRLRRQA